jgi:hypothetical protein
VTLPQGRNGLSARRRAVLYTFREPSLCRYVHRELMRKAALNLTFTIPATACHQRNYVERYSRFMPTHKQQTCPHPPSEIVVLSDNITLCHHCYGLLDENLTLVSSLPSDREEDKPAQAVYAA